MLITPPSNHPPPPALRLIKDDLSFKMSARYPQSRFCRFSRLASWSDPQLTRTPQPYLPHTNQNSRMSNDYINHSTYSQSSLQKVSSSWQQFSEVIPDKMLPLLLLVTILGTTQNEVKTTPSQPHEGHQYNRGPAAPNKGTSSAAIQPKFSSQDCWTKRLVFSLHSHQLGPSKVYIEPDLNSYNFELNTFIMRTLEEKVLFPSSLECIHAVTKGEMQFSITSFGSAKSSRLTVPLIQGQATFEEYLKGYSIITSDCWGQPFTAPDETYVAKAIVRVEGTIKVMTRHAKLVDNQSTLVITDKIIFNRTDADKHNHQPTGKSVAARVYAEAKNSYEFYKDEVFGVFVANKSAIPKDSCQTAQSVWSSSNVTVHKSRHLQHSDIIEISGKHPNSEKLSMILKSQTQICGRTVWLTAVPEMVVLY
jgi:hypothetical protein